MDARIVAEPAVINMTMVESVEVVTTIKVDDLVREFIALFDHAILVSLISDGSTSRSAVAPDSNSKGGKSALAYA